jgi:hypothetical protein
MVLKLIAPQSTCHLGAILTTIYAVLKAARSSSSLFLGQIRRDDLERLTLEGFREIVHDRAAVVSICFAPSGVVNLRTDKVAMCSSFLQ